MAILLRESVPQTLICLVSGGGRGGVSSETADCDDGGVCPGLLT